jgi:CDGSH-type Zn-finger protein
MSARVRVKPRGPLLLEGEFTLEGPDGAALGTPGMKKVLLCRCGASACRPFCDGAHNRVGFEAPPATDSDSSSGETP